MHRKITRLIYGLFIGILGSIAILFLMRLQTGKKDFNFKKLFTLHTLSRLSRIYDLIIDGIPDEDKHVVYNVLKALKSTNTLYEELFQVKRYDKFKKFVEEEGFELSDNPFIIPLIKNTKLKENVKINNSAYDLGNGLFVTSMEFTDGDKLYMSKVVQDEDSPHHASHIESEKFALSPGFNIDSKLEMFWDYYKNGVFVRSADQYQSSDFTENSDNLKIEDLGESKHKFYGNTVQQIERFHEKLLKFKNNSIQRNYLLIGKPGTGKSTFCVEVSRRISNRIMKISADLFRQFNRDDLDFIFKCLKPDSVIIDDFDRVYDDSTDADMLYFFEQLKTSYGNVTVFCTVNSMERLGEAIIRPGRFDEIIVFNLPTKQDRKTILKSYIKELGLETEPTETELNNLVEITEGFSPAYLKEYIITLKHGSTFKELINRIKQTKEFVDCEDFATVDLDSE